MSESFDLQAYLSKGIEDFMKDLLKATLTNPRGSAFMLRFAAATAAAEKIIGRVLSCEPDFLALCDESYLPEDLKEVLKELIKTRCARLD